MSNTPGSGERARGHLDDVEDGAGCTEIWERMSELRESSGERADEGGNS